MKQLYFNKDVLKKLKKKINYEIYNKKKCIRAIFIKISWLKPSGERNKITGHILLNLILRQEYGNTFFHTRVIYVFFNAKIESGTE